MKSLRTEQWPQLTAPRRPLVNLIVTALAGPWGKGEERSYRHKYRQFVREVCREAVAGGRIGVEKPS